MSERRRVAAVVPAWNEAATIGGVLRAIPRELVDHVVVVDGGSRDETAALAAAAGASVWIERRPGYGRACMAGAARAAELGAEVVVFLDASGAADPADLRAILTPILNGDTDFCLGTRTRGRAEPGSLRPVQRAGNRLAVAILAWRTGYQYSDLGSMRAIDLAALWGLGLSERAHGWPVEMQLKAALAGLRIREVPMSYRRRPGGRSKVSGSALGALRAGAAILRVALSSSADGGWGLPR